MEVGVAMDLKLIAQWLRLSFHDAGTFNQDENEGGVNGCIMTEPLMLDQPENSGLNLPVLTLQVIKQTWEDHPLTCLSISNADIIQFAGLFAVIRQIQPVGLNQAKVDSLLTFKWGRPDEFFCEPEWTTNLPGFDLGTDGNDVPLRCTMAGKEIKEKMMLRNGFTAMEATALIGAHTIGVIRESFGSFLAGPWVPNGKDDATPDGPVFDNAFHDFLINTIVASNATEFNDNIAPFSTQFPNW